MNNPSGEPANWFYVLDSRRRGPFDRPQLIRELLALEAPEGVLVWRTGLLAWTRAGALEELKRELPPPLPGATPSEDAGSLLSLPDLPDDAETEGDVEAAGEGALGGGPVSSEEGEGGLDPAGAEKRRRRRRHRKPRPSGVPSYLLPLILLFLGVMLGLWFLLRRMNEVPPGRIIQQSDAARGEASGSRSAAIPG